MLDENRRMDDVVAATSNVQAIVKIFALQLGPECEPVLAKVIKDLVDIPVEERVSSDQPTAVLAADLGKNNTHLTHVVHVAEVGRQDGSWLVARHSFLDWSFDEVFDHFGHWFALRA